MKQGKSRLIKLFSISVALLQLTACGGGGGGGGDDTGNSNQTPTARILTLTTNQDTALSITLAGSDTDGTISSYSVETQPAHGTLSGNTPDLTYTPTADYVGSDSFTFTVTDNAGATSAAATVSITVNAPPVADAQSVTLDEDVVTVITLVGSDIDGTISSYNVTTPPNHGAVSGSGPDMTYSPELNYAGSDSFTFTVTDNAGATSSAATVSITINAINDLPEATAQSVSLDEDVVTVITLAGSDIDGTISSYNVTTPAHGALSGSGPDMTYTPQLNYAGSDSFSFTVTDNNGGTSAAATVSITVNAVNDLPVATAQSVTTDEDVPTAITLAGSDVDGSIVSSNVFTSPAHGLLSGTAPNLTYTPNPNYAGSDSFSFTVTDNNGGTSAAATVSITVNNIDNDAPTAAADSFATTGNTQKTFIESVLANDSDVDTPWGNLSVTAGTITTASGGIVNMNSDGSFIYTPPAGAVSDSFTYTLNDNDAFDPKTSIGTVYMTMNGMVWYVDDSAAAGGNGTSIKPFNKPDEAATTASSGETIFVYAGSYNTEITLPMAVQLIGEATGLSVDGLTVPVGEAPILSAPSFIDVITLADSNTIKGIEITSGQRGIYGDQISNLVVQNVSFSGMSMDNISLIAPSGTVEILDSTITATSTYAVDGLYIDTTGLTGILTLNVSNTKFIGRGDLSGDGLQRAINIGDTSSGIVHTTITGSTIEGTYDDGIKLHLGGGPGGDTVTIGNGVIGNTFTGVGEMVMNLYSDKVNNISYSIQGNTIDGNGLSINHGINMAIWEGLGISATIADNSLTRIGNGFEVAMQFYIGNTAPSSEVELNITGNTMTNNDAYGIGIYANSGTISTTVNNNTFAGHLDNVGLDIITDLSGTTLCLAASGNTRSGTDEFFLGTAANGSSLVVTGAGDAGKLSANNGDIPVNDFETVSYSTTCPF